ncbi:galactokinase [Actinomyces sp. F1_1611]
MSVVIRDAWTRPDGAARVATLFTETFGQEPDGIWSAPGRVNLIGEHTDYNGGLALPIALPHRTYAALRRRDDDQVRLISAQEESQRSVDLAEAGPVGTLGEVDGWPAYVVGVAWAMRQAGYPVAGFDIAIDSCVPYGAGLSSSAALSGSAGVGLTDLFGLDLDREQLVRFCIAAENQMAGAPTGGMDQSASLRCQPGYALLLDNRDHSVQQIHFDLAARDFRLLVIDTKAPHALVDGQYAARRQTCHEAAQQLGVEYLADITDLDEALARLTDPVAQSRVRHVVTEIARTRQVAELLQKDADLAEVGRLFTESHISLRDDYEVSCPELDCAVEEALRAGAVGARMTGGGFGGSAIALVPAATVGEVMDGVVQAFAARGFAAPEFLVVEASAPGGRDA